MWSFSFTISCLELEALQVGGKIDITLFVFLHNSATTYVDQMSLLLELWEFWDKHDETCPSDHNSLCIIVTRCVSYWGCGELWALVESIIWLWQMSDANTWICSLVLFSGDIPFMCAWLDGRNGGRPPRCVWFKWSLDATTIGDQTLRTGNLPQRQTNAHILVVRDTRGEWARKQHSLVLVEGRTEQWSGQGDWWESHSGDGSGV